MGAETKKKGRSIGLIVALCLLISVCAAGGVYAYLTASTAPISNEFVPATVTCSVEESFVGGVKSDVKVRNTGNIDAYIRATVVATFVADDGKVLATAPEVGVDYTIAWGASGWKQGTDGYWYHTKAVRPNETTMPLIGAAQQSSVSAPSGYRLHIQILATAVQAAPDSAVQEAWGVRVSNGEINPN